MNYNNNSFGDVEYNGKNFHLTDQAVLSNRVFHGWWGDASEGDEYTAEYHAPAYSDEDEDDISYLVYWQFDAIKGEEPEDESDYPWDDRHIVRVDMQ